MSAAPGRGRAFRRLPLRIAGAIVALALTAGVAAATVQAPVLVRLIPGGPPAQAGQLFSGTLEVTVTEGTLELARFDLTGTGWTGFTLTAPTVVTLGPDDRLEIPFSGTPSDPQQPVVLSFGVLGRVDQHAVDVSGESERLAEPGVATSVAPSAGAPPASVVAMPEPGADVASANRWDREPDAPGSRSADESLAQSTVHVSGRFMYQRVDNKSVGVDGLTVRVYQAFFGLDPLLGSGVTDDQGWFSFDVSAIGPSPDLYVTFVASNGAVKIRSQSSSDAYDWGTATYWNVGPTLDVGWLTTADPSQRQVLHHVTVYTRVWRYLLGEMGYPMPQVGCLWPYGASDDVPWYGGGYMHLPPSNRAWAEQDLVHEYGHFWHHHFGVDAGGGYCNLPSVCDKDPAKSDCGHCTWCPESPQVAWNEGWSDWLSDVIPRGFKSLYGLAPYLPPNHEVWSPCGVAGVVDDGERTEGAFANVLRDIEDTEADDSSPAHFGTDQLDLPALYVFQTSRYDAPTGPIDFLQKFTLRYPGVNRERLWEIASDNDFDELDVAPPAPPTGLYASSHTVGVSSTDPTIDVHWVRASDDWSGVSGYSLAAGASPTLPDAITEVGDVTSWTTAKLTPGTWYISIRTRDRQGRWSTTAASVGPFLIAPAVPANLTWWTPLGWSRPAVPRPAADALPGGVGNPASLTGNTASTWANIAGRNAGTEPTPIGFFYRPHVDGQFIGAGFLSGVLAGTTAVTGINGGPLTVRGGRHVFSGHMDDLDGISEANELDNDWGHPWVWSPLVVGGVGTFTRASPPARTGGWETVLDGSPLYFNSDGLRISSLLGWWNLLWIRPANLADDYDLRLHHPSTGPQDGFATVDAYSVRLEGELDAVIVNRNVVPSPTSWDVGVINWQGASDYTAQQVVSSGMSVGDSLALVMQPADPVVIREFYAGDPSAWLAIRVEHDPADGPLHIQWLASDFTVGGLDDGSGTAVTDPVTGSGRLDFQPGTTGWHAAVIYREPKDWLNKAVPFGLKVGPAPANPQAWVGSGWPAALVPLASPGGTPASVPLPTELYGDVTLTWVNAALRNASAPGLESVTTDMHLDGMPLFSWDVGPLAGLGLAHLNDAGPFQVRGGRHTLTMDIDPLNALDEADESDNHAGRQWVWTPSTLALATPVARASPPEAEGGWGEATDVNGGWIANCDGLRTPRFTPDPSGDGRWLGASILPVGGDANLNLHEVSTGASEGFDAVLAHSGWLRNLTDFVLVNHSLTPSRPFDMGIVHVAANPTVTAEAVASTYLGIPTANAYGPFSLGAGHLMQLHEVSLYAGTWRVRLESVENTVDWGLTVHEPTPRFQSKSTPQDSAIAFREPAGADEFARITLTQAGNCAVAVWKVGEPDLAKSGTYRLYFSPEPPVAVEPPAPVRTGITALAPNPATSGAAVAFELHTDEDVALAVYDVHGARVATLARGRLPAGRHRALWDGRDAAGDAAAAGIYFVELRAGRARQVARLAVTR